MDTDLILDKYEAYADLFDSRHRAAGEQLRKPEAKHRAKKTEHEILAELTDDLTDVKLSFTTTYQPSRYEEGWLLASLASFYERGLIIDVLALVKGGKEASVYRCAAHPATGCEFLAAKVYRPRMFRNLRNDKIYREGREVLTADGRPQGKQAGTIARAMRNKTPYGLEAAHTSWLMHEYTTLETLHRAGGAVPKPFASGENALLMSYHGDSGAAAPTLNSVQVPPDRAEQLLDEVLRNVDLMMAHNLIHGDLSAYNILYWEGEITLIDFPQVVNLHNNQHARFILRRDVQRTCEYFTLQGVACDPDALADRLWARYVAQTDPRDLVADWSRDLPPDDDPGEDRWAGSPTGIATSAAEEENDDNGRSNQDHS